jgi:D-3-phosphoglycerate dehydrogenase / 2-oxoglutarate reductase
MKTVLVATDKPFAQVAVNQIKSIIESAGYQLVLLEKYTENSQLIEAVKTANAVIIRSDLITQEVINKSQNLEIVVRAGAGYDNVDLKAASAKNVVVMNTPGQNANAVAELAFEMMLYHARKGFAGVSGTELRGKAIGIHAYGNCGKYVGKIAKGFGMEVFAYDPYVRDEDILKDDVTPLKSVEELYRKCQYVSLHIPANDQTKKSINYALLHLMPKNAVLINTARKEVINEADLLKLMEERTDLSYLTDIEPDTKTEFTKFEGRYLATAKKMGAQTSEANINAGIAAANQIVKFFKTGDKTFQVNK